MLSKAAHRQASIILYLAYVGLCGVTEVNAAGSTVFWLEPRANTIIDEQVANEIGSRAGLIVLRATRNNAEAAYTFPAVVARLKESSPQTPVLSYAWANRSAERGRIEADLLRGAATGNPLAEIDDAGQGTVKFLDITNSDVRRNVVNRLSTERGRLGVDGFAVDLSTRTPSVRPKPLANICQKKAGFCENYSEGMDELFAKLRASLGKDGVLVYNGLFNFEPGQIEDQAKLLDQADAVAVEYFGMDPNETTHGFSTDILPYLNIIPRLPKNKAALVFARGPWAYSDYVTDYRWQRYLYASFLLASRENDLFKYHASFQIPAHKGRAGGLDVYADWNVRLGDALGPFKTQGGLYQREFSRGMVVVAPDDGEGGQVRIAGVKYTLDGQKVAGMMKLHPGEGLILVSQASQLTERPVRHVMAAQGIAPWRWANAGLKKTSNGDYLKLETLPAQMNGEHDLLLDYERSLTPFQELEINVRLPESSSSLLAVAEVDDPGRKQSWVVVEVSTKEFKGKQRTQEAVDFRAPPRKRNPASWPLIHIQYKPDQQGMIVLDGAKILEKTGYRFRRWSHLRFAGPLELFSVSLGNPVRIQ